MDISATSLFKITLSTCLLVSIPAMSLAATTTPQKWKLDVPKTNVDFQVAYLGGAIIKGQFNKVNGAINYDAKNPTATTINFTVHSNSVNTGRRLRDNFLRRKELLNAEQYPTMTFVSKTVSMINPKEANVTGDFTVLGQTKPLTVKVTLATVEHDPATLKPILSFRANGMIDRYAYGVTAFPRIVGNMIPLEISGNLIAAN